MNMRTIPVPFAQAKRNERLSLSRAVMPKDIPKDMPSIPELVINWHLTESCNFHCGYCYSTWQRPDTKRELWKDSAKTQALLNSITQYFSPGNLENPLHRSIAWEHLRLNLAGGEPMLASAAFERIVTQASSKGMRLSLITNGSFLNNENIQWLAPSLSILGISVDSVNDAHNQLIGRCNTHGQTLSQDHLALMIQKVREANPDIQIKINSVVNMHNRESDLNSFIQVIQPDKWKVLRALPVVSDAMCISDQQFNDFVRRHSEQEHLMRVEGNEQMRQSYIMIDPHGRFYQNAKEEKETGYHYSDPILTTGIDKSFDQVQFQPVRFADRYAAYN